MTLAKLKSHFDLKFSTPLHKFLIVPSFQCIAVCWVVSELFFLRFDSHHTHPAVVQAAFPNGRESTSFSFSLAHWLLAHIAHTYIDPGKSLSLLWFNFLHLQTSYIHNTARKQPCLICFIHTIASSSVGYYLTRHSTTRLD